MISQQLSFYPLFSSVDGLDASVTCHVLVTLGTKARGREERIAELGLADTYFSVCTSGCHCKKIQGVYINNTMSSISAKASSSKGSYGQRPNKGSFSSTPTSSTEKAFNTPKLAIASPTMCSGGSSLSESITLPVETITAGEPTLSHTIPPEEASKFVCSTSSKGKNVDEFCLSSDSGSSSIPTSSITAGKPMEVITAGAMCELVHETSSPSVTSQSDVGETQHVSGDVLPSKTREQQQETHDDSVQDNYTAVKMKSSEDAINAHNSGHKSSGLSFPINREELLRRRESAHQLIKDVGTLIMHPIDGYKKKERDAPLTAKTEADDTRRLILAFDDLHNFRDLGGLVTSEGHVVKRGMIYRMARPDNMSENDLRNIIETYNIKTIVDLRRQIEIDRSAGSKLAFDKYTMSLKHAQRMRIGGFLTGPKYEVKLRRFHVSLLGSYYMASTASMVPDKHEMVKHGLRDLFGYGQGRAAEKYIANALMRDRGLTSQYADMVDTCKAQIGVIMKIVTTKQNQGVVVHCSHGKDRTGLIAALVLTTLGVSDDDIAKDYSLSTRGLAVMRDTVVQEICHESGLSEEFSQSVPETMLATLAYIRKKYSSVSEYLLRCSFTIAWQNKLRSNMLDKGEKVSSSAPVHKSP
eukprot:CFRG4813T1